MPLSISCMLTPEGVPSIKLQKLGCAPLLYGRKDKCKFIIGLFVLCKIFLGIIFLYPKEIYKSLFFISENEIFLLML